MALIWADRVAETTTTTGTGNISLAGAIAGYRDFDSVCANGDTVYACIEAINAAGTPTGQWEVFLGTFTDVDTLARTTILDSSNAGAAVNFAAGTKRVLLVEPAQAVGRTVRSLANGNVGIGGGPDPTEKLQVNVNTGVNGFESGFSLTNTVDANFFAYVTGTATTDKRAFLTVGAAGQSLAFGTLYTERMRIDVNGNVGIGTVPDSKLHVQGPNTGLRVGFGGTSQNYYDADNHYFRTGAAASLVTINNTGSVAATGDFRAPIFYDSQNTAFYTDPASTSNLNFLNVAGGSVYRSDWVAPFHSGSDFVNGTLVTSDIPATAENGDSFVIEITGKSYTTANPPFKVIVQGYLYAFTITSFSGISFGGNFAPYIKVFEEGGVLKFWWPTISYWNSFDVVVKATINPTDGNISRNRVTSIVNSTEPTGTKKVQVNLSTFMRADISATNPVDLRAPIFYDSQNTNYFVDPASTSVFNAVRAGSIQHGNSQTVINLNDSTYLQLRDPSANNRIYLGNATDPTNYYDNTTHIFRTAAAANMLIVTGTGDVTATTSLRAPIFYDQNNTAFYTDPAGTSELNGLQVRGTSMAVHGTGGLPYIDLLTTGVVGGRNWRIQSGITGTANGGFSIRDLTSSTNVFNIDDAGNIGIGYGTARGNISLSYGSAGSVTTKTIHFGYAPADFYGFRIAHSQDAAVNGAGVFHIQRGTTVAWINALSILDQGNVGIGTSNPAVKFVVSNNGVAGIEFSPTGGLTGGPYIQTYDRVSGLYLHLTNYASQHTWYAGATRVMDINTGGDITASVDFRAPIFYDANNTGFYVDPNATSNIQALIVGSTITGSVSGSSTFLPTRYDSGVIANPQQYFGRTIGLRVAMTGLPVTWADTLWINGYAGGDVPNMCALHFSRQGTPRMWISTQDNEAITYGTYYEFPTYGYNSVGSTGNLYAGIVYDANNTAYALDPAGNSTFDRLTARKSGVTLGSGNSSQIEVNNAGSGACNISFHREGLYGAHFGLDTDNVFSTFGWSAGSGYTSMRVGGFESIGGRPLSYNPSNGSLIIKGDAGGWGTGLYFQGSGGTTFGGFGGLGGADTFSYWWVGTDITTSAMRFYAGGAGYAEALVSLRAPIFYDYNNTAFYVDPATGTALTGNVAFAAGSRVANNGDFYAVRDSGTTGVLYFAGGGSIYLYWNGSSFILSGGYTTSDTSFRAPIFYDSNNTAFYLDPTATSVVQTIQFGSFSGQISGNDSTSFTAFRFSATSKGGYFGHHLQGVANSFMPVMYDGAGNGGTYYETSGRWSSYYLYANDCWGFGTSATFAGFNINCPTGIRSGGRSDGTIFYDTNDSAYYTDPNATSRTNTIIGNIYGRPSHQTGYLQGGYNNLGASEGQTSPIYVIGSSYIPAATTLSNMYGIGFTSGGSFFPSGASGWGLYVCGNGVARVHLGGDNGEITATGNITAYASDRRLKTNITPISNALDKLMRIRGVEFDWVSNIEELGFVPQTIHETGVIAQEIQEVIPDAVKLAPFNKHATELAGFDSEYLTVDKEKIIPLLIEAIKEQQMMINILNDKINLMESK